MKKILIFLFSLLSSFPVAASYNSAPYTIVFVHIGTTLPDYVETAITQAHMFNTECDIVLIGNEVALEQLEHADLPDNFFAITCESLIKTPEHEEFLRNSTLDKEFRGGFWTYASERFLYLHDFIAQFGVTNVFHLEYDNMLYVNLQEILPVFLKRYKGIGATFDNDQRCIAGFIYISGPESMGALARFMAESVKEGHTDMEMLALFKDAYGEKWICHLPIIMKEYMSPEYSSKCDPESRNKGAKNRDKKTVTKLLCSARGHTVKDERMFCLGIQDFKSIFDAAAIGQYLGGIDPRLGPSEPGFINESCIFNPSLLTYDWRLDKAGRRVPFATYGGVSYRINNLHIHSKNLKAFLSK